LEGEVEDGGGLGYGAGGVEEELPVALVEEEAEGEPRAEESGKEREGEGFGEPEGVDDFDGGVGALFLGWLAGGVGFGWRHCDPGVDSSC
jgi:hypothetical protein